MYAMIALITASLTPFVQHWALVLVRRHGGEDWDIDQIAIFLGGFTALLLFGVLLSLFDNYLWRSQIGAGMFRLSGLAAPPDLSGRYSGTVEVQSAGEAQREARRRCQARPWARQTGSSGTSLMLAAARRWAVSASSSQARLAARAAAMAMRPSPPARAARRK